ncbi:ATP-dependent RNA helicase DOB1 [Dendrobium catenatum]|uniref:ATP-dependent RNA helicase DOB1 n=1 Tax=Dendrobium catenatum TaxID=906689 RepID=A0A2I0WY40_9ASPA|nr:ATP-dependent RNA helicase DOB1 [Dendrobium catenatum]
MSSLIKRKSVDGATPENPIPYKSQRKDEPMVIDDGVTCLHDVSYPEGYVASRSGPTRPTEGNLKPAKEFPFVLDPFQSEAIRCIENGESVMCMKKQCLSPALQPNFEKLIRAWNRTVPDHFSHVSCD